MNSDLEVVRKSDCLSGVRVAFCGGGGIAAIEMPRFVRELRRFGANVRCVVTDNCLRFVGRESLEWATTQPVVTLPTGNAEHIVTDDLVVVFPATADLISKMALGICDSGVTTLVQSALGKRKTVIVCPTMHESLGSSPIIEENLARLAQLPGVAVLPSRVEEGKAKALSPEQFALEVAHAFNKNKNGFANKRAVVTLGGTRTSIDPVRCLTNLSTGTLGALVAEELYANGVSVNALEGNVERKVTRCSSLLVKRVPDYFDMRAALEKCTSKNTDAILHIAAVSDFAAKRTQSEKVSSNTRSLVLEFVPTQKLLAMKNLQGIRYKLACKLTTKGADGKKTAKEMLKENKLSTVLWNNADGAFEHDKHRATLITATSESVEFLGKKNIALAITQDVIKQLTRPK